jgi:hypothetical protein
MAIDLIHNFSKLVTKILALSLQPLMQSLISSCKIAFIIWRKIHAYFMYVQEMIKELKNNKVLVILLELDINKCIWIYFIGIYPSPAPLERV